MTCTSASGGKHQTDKPLPKTVLNSPSISLVKYWFVDGPVGRGRCLHWWMWHWTSNAKWADCSILSRVNSKCLCCLHKTTIGHSGKKKIIPTCAERFSVMDLISIICGNCAIKSLIQNLCACPTEEITIARYLFPNSQNLVLCSMFRFRLWFLALSGLGSAFKVSKDNLRICHPQKFVSNRTLKNDQKKANRSACKHMRESIFMYSQGSMHRKINSMIFL